MHAWFAWSMLRPIAPRIACCVGALSLRTVLRRSWGDALVARWSANPPGMLRPE
jgi:hypothetical protein